MKPLNNKKNNNKFAIMLKRNSIKVIQTLDHTDSSRYRNENQLAVWVILEIF